MEKENCNISRWQLLKEQLNNLSPTEYQNMLKLHPDLQLIDVRTPQEFESYHLPNAININYLGNDFWKKIKQLDSTRPCIVYCRTGRRSVRTCTMMRNGGFSSDLIFNLDGGLVAWQEM